MTAVATPVTNANTAMAYRPILQRRSVLKIRRRKKQMETRVNVAERIEVGCDTSCHLRPVKISGM